MFFIKSGECRVVMEVSTPSACVLPFLPRAASSLCQYRPTTHDQCKKEAKEVRKQWGHLILHTRPYTCQAERSLSAPPGGSPVSVPRRPYSAPLPRRSNQSEGLQRPATPKRTRRSQASGMVPEDAHGHNDQEHVQKRQKFDRSKQSVHAKQRRLSNLVKQQLEEHESQEREERIKDFAKVARRSRPFSQMSLRTYKTKRVRKETPPPKESMTYSLQTLMREITSKFGNDAIQDLDFSDKEALVWGMGTCDTGLQRGDIGDALQYQSKFEEWAKKVISRERRVLKEEFSDSGLPSYRSVVDETNRDRSLQKIQLLDVGGLHAGEFFGEVGLLTKNRRCATILTVTEVEVLVLTNSDFCRRLDKDIIECLSSNNYKKADHVHNQFHRTHRWEAIKKRIMKDALMLKKSRFPNRFYHDMSEASRRKGPILV